MVKRKVNFSLFNLRRAMNEIMIPELVRRILYEFDESDQQAPWMRSVYDQTFKQYASNLLL